MFEGSFQCIYKVCLVKIARPNLSQNFMNMEKTIDLTPLYIQINNTVGFFPNHTHIKVIKKSKIKKTCEVP